MKPVIPPPRGISPSTFLRQAINLLSERAARRSKKWRSPRELRHSCSSTITYGLKVVRVATASERPSVGPGRARGNEPARLLLWHPGQYKVPTNDEPRHQPTRPETRPNQRLYVPLGSPPSVAVGSSSARAAHRSRAPQIDRYTRNDLDCGASKDFKVPGAPDALAVTTHLRLCRLCHPAGESFSLGRCASLRQAGLGLRALRLVRCSNHSRSPAAR